MTSGARLLTLIACATISTGSYAQRCEGNVYKAAVTLAALPVEVRTAILRDSRLADRGEAFQEGDLVLERNPPPSRRFSIAAVSERQIVVAIEVGGGGANTELWWFGGAGNHWKGSSSRFFSRPHFALTPDTLPELLYWICPKYPEPPPRPIGASVPAL